MLSVCLATYNGSKYIKGQIESILPQLSPEDELIVSDDASTDETSNTVLSINDNRIRLVTNESVHGITGNFENAINLAKGDYVFLSDQDDKWLPNKVELFMAEFKNEVHRYLAGYSLSGLFSLYALYHTDLFEGIACMSGSLWYEGWIPYMKKHEMCRKPEKIYFSLGDQEAKGNSQMRTVTERTEETKRYMEHLGISTILEWNPGNHFRDVPERIARGIDWLMTDAE